MLSQDEAALFFILAFALFGFDINLPVLGTSKKSKLTFDSFYNDLRDRDGPWLMHPLILQWATIAGNFLVFLPLWTILSDLGTTNIDAVRSNHIFIMTVVLIVTPPTIKWLLAAYYDSMLWMAASFVLAVGALTNFVMLGTYMHKETFSLQNALLYWFGGVKPLIDLISVGMLYNAAFGCCSGNRGPRNVKGLFRGRRGRSGGH